MASRSPYSRTRNKQLVRVLRLIATLEGGRQNLAELSRQLSVSPRTIRRDVEALAAAHVAFTTELIDGVRYWWKHS